MSGHKYGVCVGQAIDMADQKFEAQIPEKSPDSVNPIPNQNHPQKPPIQHQIQGNLNESVVQYPSFPILSSQNSLR